MIYVFAGISMFLLVILILTFFRISVLETRHEKELKAAREDAVKRSKAITRGHVTQEVVPILNGFPYSMSDCKFSGAPLDYIVFDGMSEYRDGNKDKEITIIFADVKYGKAHKTPVQKEIVDAIKAGRIRFEDWKVDEYNKITIQ